MNVWVDGYKDIRMEERMDSYAVGKTDKFFYTDTTHIHI
jgi:hypothetical protein